LNISLNKFSRFVWNADLTLEDCPVLAMAHATDLSIAKKIIVSGFASLSTLDDGFYGKGMYFSSSVIYTLPYFSSASNPCILICFLLPGNPFPVIEHPNSNDSLSGVHIYSGYQSHYVLTKRNGNPFEEEDDYQKFNEIVIDQQVQVVPIFMLELDRSNFAELAVQFTRETANKTQFLEDTNIFSTHDQNDEVIEMTTNTRINNMDYQVLPLSPEDTTQTKTVHGFSPL